MAMLPLPSIPHRPAYPLPNRILMQANSSMTATVAAWSLVVLLGTPALGQSGAPSPAADTANDAIRTMVGRLELEKYKATVKGLTQFGDRRQGTKRNRDAVDWIEAQLKSYGCTNTERITYDYAPAPPRANAGAAGAGGANRPAPGEPGTVQSVGPTNGQGG